MCKLAFSIKEIILCFVASKRCLIVDSDEKAAKQFRKLTFIEFLEFISRLSFQLFKDTESQDLTLDKKIEYMLDDIFALDNTKRVERTVYIKEFCEFFALNKMAIRQRSRERVTQKAECEIFLSRFQFFEAILGLE